MIDLHELARQVESTIQDPERQNEAIKRLLFATARKHNRTLRELQCLKQELGRDDSPLNFLSLPREIRDEVYLYSLRPIGSATHVSLIPWYFLTAETYASMHKPPIPGLLTTSKQVYTEARDILYTKNIFYFDEPHEITEFAKDIGSVNSSIVQQISINAVFTTMKEPTVADGAMNLYTSKVRYPSDWARALNSSQLGNINHIKFSVESIYSINALSLLPMPNALQQAIERIFKRRRDVDILPRLSLKGFQHTVPEMFPKDWKVVREPNEGEIAAQRESEELGKSKEASGSGELANQHDHFSEEPVGEDNDGERSDYVTSHDGLD
ncbi:hypothetical protein BJ878DRAFT_42376 [Calycina marina]|uniref:Uncharacterized protein n=1 Tax=Calycina marina TaxID=1763456 RepID=A0A9P8CH00_9HELO|nr:hypothetical protein BJ878DRAFT_42376 [Calycina marina]